MKTSMFTLFLALSIIGVRAQSLSEKDIPAKAVNQFSKAHPSLEYAGDWKKVGDNYVVEYEVHYVPNFDTYDANGNYLDTRQKTMVKFFPKCVKSYLYAHYSPKGMKKAAVVTNPDNTTYYQVETKGKLLKFDNNCKLVSSDATTNKGMSVR